MSRKKNTKNIIICCDGTNNEVKKDQTNVFRLYKCLENDPQRQVLYYDPGVGTIDRKGLDRSENLFGEVRRNLRLVLGLAFGFGLTKNLEEAYQFLMNTYEDGDRIYLFGFSRGAFTVRALAGMIHMCGLLHRYQENLLPYVSRMYTLKDYEAAKDIKKTTRKNIEIEFMGLWDTVTSLGNIYRRKTLPYTVNNDIVRVVRHALSIDERRAYFRQNRWSRTPKKNQSVKEVWFAGVHSDIGGGYLYKEGKLSLITFHWMLEELRASDVSESIIFDTNEIQLILGTDKSQQSVEEPSAIAHTSLKNFWWILEYLPKNSPMKKWKIFFPRGRHRTIFQTDVIHQSVFDRIDAYGESYQPSSLVAHDIEELTKEQQKNEFVDFHFDPKNTKAKTNRKSLTERISRRFLPIITYYIIITVVILLVNIIVFLLDFIDKNKFLEILSGIQWPFKFYQWLWTPTNLKALFNISVPLSIFGVGSMLIERLSGMKRFKLRVEGNLIHKSTSGYSHALLQRQLEDLREDGRAGYRKMLSYDLGFPLVYGAGLIWALCETFSCSLVLIIPLITILSDWIENRLLLKQLKRFEANKGTSGVGVDIASIATIAKILTFTGALILIAWPILRSFII